MKHAAPSEQFIIILKEKKKLAAMFPIMDNVCFHRFLKDIADDFGAKWILT